MITKLGYDIAQVTQYLFGDLLVTPHLKLVIEFINYNVHYGPKALEPEPCITANSTVKAMLHLVNNKEL